MEVVHQIWNRCLFIHIQRRKHVQLVCDKAKKTKVSLFIIFLNKSFARFIIVTILFSYHHLFCYHHLSKNIVINIREPDPLFSSNTRPLERIKILPINILGCQKIN
jgi:hypothetical protein